MIINLQFLCQKTHYLIKILLYVNILKYQIQNIMLSAAVHVLNST